MNKEEKQKKTFKQLFKTTKTESSIPIETKYSLARKTSRRTVAKRKKKHANCNVNFSKILLRTESESMSDEQMLRHFKGSMGQ